MMKSQNRVGRRRNKGDGFPLRSLTENQALEEEIYRRQSKRNHGWRPGEGMLKSDGKL